MFALKVTLEKAGYTVIYNRKIEITRGISAWDLA